MMIEAGFTPAHANSLGSVLDEPFAGTLHHTTSHVWFSAGGTKILTGTLNGHGHLMGNGFPMTVKEKSRRDRNDTVGELILRDNGTRMTRIGRVSWVDRTF